MPGNVIKAALQQLRHQTMEEKAANRVVLRDTQQTVAILREKVAAQNCEDITEQEWPEGHQNRDGETTEKTLVTVEPTCAEVSGRPTVGRRLASKTDVQSLKHTKSSSARVQSLAQTKSHKAEVN